MNTVRLNTANDDKVVVRKNAGGTGGGSSAIEYLDVSQTEGAKLMICAASLLINIDGEIVPPGLVSMGNPSVLTQAQAIAIDFSLKCKDSNGVRTIKESIELTTGKDFLSAIPRITEEEFYSI